MAALSRVANGSHKYIKLIPGDTVIFSSSPIPGNAEGVNKTINALFKCGANVIVNSPINGTHTSGHANQGELRLLHSLARPRYFMPIHGEYKHLAAHKELAKAMGMPSNNIFVGAIGDTLELTHKKAAWNGSVPSGVLLVDGNGVGDVGNIVLRDRQNLAQNGIIIVVLALEKYSNQLLSGPDIVSRGFVYVRESEDLMEEAQAVVDQAVWDCLDRHITDWGKIKNIIRDDLAKYIYRETKRKPMILPIIMDI